jgi:hypothetical protein
MSETTTERREAGIADALKDATYAMIDPADRSARERTPARP